MTNAPEKIYNWLDSQLSIARHYGGMSYNGHNYQIDYEADGQPLVRMDVFKAEQKAKKPTQSDVSSIESNFEQVSFL